MAGVFLIFPSRLFFSNIFRHLIFKIFTCTSYRSALRHVLFFLFSIFLHSFLFFLSHFFLGMILHPLHFFYQSGSDTLKQRVGIFSRKQFLSYSFPFQMAKKQTHFTRIQKQSSSSFFSVSVSIFPLYHVVHLLFQFLTILVFPKKIFF